MSDALLGLGSPTDPFAAVAALVALVGDPKGCAVRLKQLQAALAAVEKGHADLAAERSAVEADLQGKRAACDAELASGRAAIEKSEESYRTLFAKAAERERQFDGRLAYADRVIKRFNVYWRIRIDREMGGASPLVSIPSIFSDQDEPADAHYRTAAEGSFEPGADAGADQVREDINGAPFPAGTTITRRSMSRGVET